MQISWNHLLSQGHGHCGALEGKIPKFAAIWLCSSSEMLSYAEPKEAAANRRFKAHLGTKGRTYSPRERGPS